MKSGPKMWFSKNVEGICMGFPEPMRIGIAPITTVKNVYQILVIDRLVVG